MCAPQSSRNVLLAMTLKASRLCSHHGNECTVTFMVSGTSRNFNVPAAMCADYVIAEVENLYTLGELDSNAIHTSGIFVDAVVRADIDYCVLREEKFSVKREADDRRPRRPGAP